MAQEDAERTSALAGFTVVTLTATRTPVTSSSQKQRGYVCNQCGNCRDGIQPFKPTANRQQYYIQYNVTCLSYL
jgi:hypothetical protein